MWLIVSYILILATIIYFSWNESKSRIIYLVIGICVVLIFVSRFACDNITCTTNVFLGDIISGCRSVCQECEDFKESISTITNQSLCKECQKCKADWNIRAAFDTSGMAWIGVLLSIIFLYKKNYPLKALMRGIETITLFGVLSLKLSQIEKNVQNLTDEIQSELIDEHIQKKVAIEYEAIHNKSNTPFDTLHLLIDKIESEYLRLNNFFKKAESVISLQKQNQFDRLSKIVQDLLSFAKDNWTSKFINKAIILSKRILLLIFGLSDYLKTSSSYSNKKILTNSMGVDIVDDKYRVIIPKGSIVPVEKSGIFYTTENEQKEILSKVLIGENPIASRNIELGKVNITGIPRLPAGEAKITILFKIDKNSILIVKQICYETGKIVQAEFDVNKYLVVENK